MSGRAYGSSTVKRRRRTAEELAAVDRAIIAAVTEENPVTLRGVYYRVVSAGAVDKTELGYRLVGRQLLKLRRSGVIPYTWITDGTRWITKPRTWGDLGEMLDDVTSSYRRELWNDQRAEVHIFTEKDAVSGVILPVTHKYQVPLGVLRGYASESFAHSVAESIRATPKPVYIYQLGDHDPSGLDAWRDFQRKVIDFLGGTEAYNEVGNTYTQVHFERLAVTPQQIRALNLPTRPTKRTDARTKGFEGGSVEVDAIPPNILRGLVEEAIERHIDPHARELTLMAERNEREGLRRLRGMIGGDAWASD